MSDHVVTIEAAAEFRRFRSIMQSTDGTGPDAPWAAKIDVERIRDWLQRKGDECGHTAFAYSVDELRGLL